MDLFTIVSNWGFRLISLSGISRLICGHSTVILTKSSKIVDIAVFQTNLSLVQIDLWSQVFSIVGFFILLF